MTFIEGLPGGGSKTRLDVGERENPSPPVPGVGVSTPITTALDGVMDGVLIPLGGVAT